MMDYFLYMFFDYSTNPLEIAVRFMFLLVVFDSIFGIIGTLLSSLKGR